MTSHPPRRLIGPPDWLSPGWGVTRQEPIAELPQPEAIRERINMRAIVSKIDGCAFLGPVIGEGCNCKRLCYLGKGTRRSGEVYGVVYRRDCWDCVSDES